MQRLPTRFLKADGGTICCILGPLTLQALRSFLRKPRVMPSMYNAARWCDYIWQFCIA